MKKAILINILLLLVGIIIGYKYFQYDNHKKMEAYANTVSFNHRTLPLDTLKRRVMEKGDTSAYKDLRIEFLNKNFYESEILLYSIAMANKYSYPPANVDVYRYLTSIYEHDKKVGKIDQQTLKLAIEYLNRGVKLNDYDAKRTLRDLYLHGKYLQKDTAKAKALTEMLGEYPRL